ncbi:MAG: pentapeptide repeat-containing protein [bacterium]
MRGADLFCAFLDEAELADAHLDGVCVQAAVLEAAMRDLQARAQATGAVAWFLEAVKVGELDGALLSVDGTGPAAALLRALPVGARPEDHPLPALVAFWLTPVGAPTWPGLLADHQAWVASRGREGNRLSAPRADLRGRDLQGLDLRGAALLEARLHGADLRGARLDDALLSAADLTGADLRGASARRAHLRGARLVGARIDADLRGADLREVAFDQARVEGIALRDARVVGTELREATWDALRDAWCGGLAGFPTATRAALRALQGGIPPEGLAGVLDAAGAPLPAALAPLADALEPGAMAVTHGIARLLADWTLAFIRQGGTAASLVSAAPTPLDPATLKKRLADHGRWLASDGANGKRLDLSGALAYGLDFTGADLRRADLAGSSLRGSVFDGADLRETDCRAADLRESRFMGTDLRGARLGGARLEGGALPAVQLAGAELAGTSFARSLLTGARFEGARLVEVSLASAVLTGADFSDATLDRCDLRGWPSSAPASIAPPSAAPGSSAPPWSRPTCTASRPPSTPCARRRRWPAPWRRRCATPRPGGAWATCSSTTTCRPPSPPSRAAGSRP